MDRIPNEILHQIFPLAVTDGGSTGRSLALVSRHFHEMSKEYRLQSISLCSHTQATSFALMLDRTPLRERRIVELQVQFDDTWWREDIWRRTCYIASPSESNPALVLDSSSSRKAGRDRQYRLQSQLRNDQRELEFVSTVKHILLQSHPRDALRTLTLGSLFSGRRVPNVDWVWSHLGENLTSLTINMTIMYISDFRSMAVSHGSLRSLHYLDIAEMQFYQTHGSKFKLISAIRDMAPSLVYLRINVSFAMMEWFDPRQWLHNENLESQRTLPGTIKLIFIQCDTDLVYPEMYQWDLEIYTRLVDTFRNLAKTECRFKVVHEAQRSLGIQQLLDGS
ncbi:hypothetical protein HWV62_41326 [Athelia sp. TMB]|nr:hypothetical protein HWV62_41326 [Athelia sp. TMB]